MPHDLVVLFLLSPGLGHAVLARRAFCAALAIGGDELAKRANKSGRRGNWGIDTGGAEIARNFAHGAGPAFTGAKGVHILACWTIVARIVADIALELAAAAAGAYDCVVVCEVVLVETTTNGAPGVRATEGSRGWRWNETGLDPPFRIRRGGGRFWGRRRGVTAVAHSCVAKVPADRVACYFAVLVHLRQPQLRVSVESTLLT